MDIQQVSGKHEPTFMKNLVLGLITLLSISCDEKPKVEFSLNGNTNGIDHGTILYLDDNSPENNLIDSAIVNNNSFSFRTKLPKTPLQVVLRTKDYSNYRFLWLENKPMTFNGTETDFRRANVTGSDSENLQQSLSRATDTLSRDEQTKKEIEFVNRNPSSIVSAYILSVYSKTWGKEKTSELFNLFSNENRASPYGQKIQRYIELNKNPDIGQSYVDFEMKDINGLSRKLSEFDDKLVLLEFWASWCGPCRQENPNLVKTYKEYHPKGFEIFAVSLDASKERWKKAIKKDSLPWTHVSDLEGNDNTAGLIYGVYGIPDNFLINQNGKIIARNLRGDELNNKLAELTK